MSTPRTAIRQSKAAQEITESRQTIAPYLPNKSRRLNFWYLGILGLYLGLAQIVSVGWCLLLFVGQGITPHTMHVAFIGSAITTLSSLSFKVLQSTG